jgi:hypothetical protein
MPVRLPLLMSLLVALTLGCAADPKEPAAAAKNDESGFVSLFNGRDLTGWVYGKTDKGGPYKQGNGYQVRDGAIYSTVKDGGNLFSEKEYDDFVFRFEFKLTPQANNGIAIRAPLQGNPAYQGMEIQVLDEATTKYGKLNADQYHGAIYGVVAAEKGHLNPIGEWNQQEIRAVGRQITITLNGAKILDANLADITDPEILKKHPGLTKKGGHIGFMGHGAEVEFRNLRIKDLSADRS